MWFSSILTLTNTRRSGPPKETFFSKFKYKLLCPVHTLQVYEQETANLRSHESKENRLFISFRKPHKPVCSASIARWVKTAAGIAETEQCKAHSTRAVSTSAVKVSGV